MAFQSAALRSYFNFHKGVFFLVLCVINALILYVYNHFILTEDLYVQTYSEKVALERIREFLDFKSTADYFSYGLTPLFLLIKISFTAVCLNMGTLLANWKVSFGRLFKIALVAEGLFVLANVLRAVSIGTVVEIHSLFDLQFYYPFSLINFFGPESLDPWFIYPVYLVNLFEVGYFLALAVGLNWATGKPIESTLKLVAASYGTGLLLWVAIVMFLSINLS